MKFVPYNLERNVMVCGRRKVAIQKIFLDRYDEIIVTELGRSKFRQLTVMSRMLPLRILNSGHFHLKINFPVRSLRITLCIVGKQLKSFN